MEDDIKFQITTLLREEIQGELNIRRPARDYAGKYKPRSGKYPTPESKKSLTGQLSQSVMVYFTGNIESDNLTLNVDFGNTDYWYYVDKGRKPGNPITKRRQRLKKNGELGKPFYVEDYTKYPPLSSILQWVRQRPALQGSGADHTRDASATDRFAQYGIYGINFIDSALRDVEDKVVELYGDLGQEVFLRIIEKKIILPTQ